MCKLEGLQWLEFVDSTHPDGQGGAFERRLGGPSVWERSYTLSTSNDRGLASDLDTKTDSPGKVGCLPHGRRLEEAWEHFGCGGFIRFR